MTPILCNGRGGDGGHCCWIDGKVCEFLFTDRGGTPRCSIFDQFSGDSHPSQEWLDAPVGQWFAETYPGYHCGDWPQNIPEVMAKADVTGPFGLCCWGRGNV